MQISQIESKQGRFYSIDNGGNKTVFPSVGTILNFFQPTEFLNDWAIRLGKKIMKEAKYATFSPEEEKALVFRLGKTEAERIRVEAAERGKKFHVCIEKYFKEDKQLDEEIAIIAPLLKEISAIAIEHSLYYVDGDYGFGGTLDLVGLVNGLSFVDEWGQPLSEETIPCLIDWKVPNNNKSARSVGSKGRIYYPVIRYCLQASAYIKAWNSSLKNEAHKIERGLIVFFSKSRELKIIYLNQKAIEWYWQNFEKMLKAFFNGDSFNWKNFEVDTDRQNLLGIELFF